MRAYEESVALYRSGASAAAVSAASAAGAVQLVSMKGLVPALNHCASAYAKVGRVADAEQLWQEVIDGGDSSQRAAAHQNRAVHRERSGDGLGALADYDAAVTQCREAGEATQLANNLVACVGLLQEAGAAGAADNTARAAQHFTELVAVLSGLGRTLEQNCTICLEELGTPAPNQVVVVVGGCFHAFHGHCLAQARASTRSACPLCNV